MTFDEERQKMIQDHLKRRGITSKKILDAFISVPRQWFVPEDNQCMSYADMPLPIGKGQTISQPFIIAFMMELAQLKSSDKVLDVGTGSGYSSALISKVVDKVITIERIEELHQRAKECLSKHEFSNVTCVWGDGTQGCEEYAPYDAILVAAATPDIPETLKLQLKVGGRLILPVGDNYFQSLVTVKRASKTEFKEAADEYVRFVPLLEGVEKDLKE